LLDDADYNVRFVRLAHGVHNVNYATAVLNAAVECCERVNVINMTGDAMGRPLVEALREKTYDLSSLMILTSSAAIFSPSVKLEFLDRIPHMMMLDALGASEQGMTGIMFVTRESLLAPQEKNEGKGLRINPGRDVTVFDDDFKPIEPGSGKIGRLARGGNIPYGYYKDPQKTAEVFIEVDGKRWSIAGDLATIDADGSVVMFGRGSTSINSGGEKIYPEEVEAALKAHPSVFDCLVVGVADERWGQRVAAVVQLRNGHSLSLDELDKHARTQIAGYKIPRELHLVPEIKRAPSGKPDYPWAQKLAAAGAHRC